MATTEMQERVKETLGRAEDGLSMSDLVDQINISESPASIRAAVLPLISLHEVELTPDRKLRLVKVEKEALVSAF